MQYLNKCKDFEDKVRQSKINWRRVFGINFYPIIRRGLKFKYIKDGSLITSTNFRNYRLSVFYRVFVSTIKSFFSLRFLFSSRSKFLFLGFSRRVIDKDAVAIDKFHDPIIDTLESEDCLLIEKPFRFGHSDKRHTKCNILDFDFVVYLSIIVGVVISPVVYLLQRRNIELLCRDIAYTFPNESIGTRSLTLLVSKFLSDLFFSRLLLSIIKPEKLIVTSRWLHYPFIYACKEKNIETIELQHGCVMKENVFYCKFDEEQFDVDVMAVFSDFWIDRNWNTKTVTTFSVNDSIESNRKNVSEERENKLDDSVLIISQPEMSSYLDNDLIKIAESNPELNFFVKLHPQDVDGYEYRYRNSQHLINVNFIADLTVDSRELTKKYDLVIGYTSSVLFEAYDANCSVGLIHNEEIDSDYYKALYGNDFSAFHSIYPGDKIKSSHFVKGNNRVSFFAPLDKEKVKVFFNEKNF